MRILDFERSCNKTLGSSRKYICLDSKVFGYEMASTRHIQAWETKGKMKWTTALSDIILLPILLLISIPLALSASITTGLALIMLLIRALVVYFELSIALLANFFFFPAHSPTSGSFLALTEGNTPSVERTTPYARAPKYSSHVGAQQTGFAKSRRESWSSKEGFVEDYFSHHNHSQHGHAPLHSPHEALSSFISGNAERDFEGVGGWRTPLSSRKKSSASSVSHKNSSEEELLLDNDDDEAWLSINKRLELPSRRSPWKNHCIV